MTCEEFVAYLSSYLDNELDADLTAAAREHLATCHNCHVVMDTTRRVIILGRGESQHTIPATRRDALFVRLQEAFLHAPRQEM